METDLPVVAHSVIPYLPKSGSWIYAQIRALSRYRPIVITKRVENLESFPFDPIYSRSQLSPLNQLYQRLWRRWVRGYFPFYRRVLVENHAGVLHSHFGDWGYADMRLKQDLGIPQVTSFYGADIWVLCRDPRWRRRYRDFFAVCDGFLVEGNAMRNKVIDVGCPPDKVRVQHLGVDLERIAFEPRRSASDGEVRFLVAGRAMEKKGHEVAIRAFAEVHRRHPKARLGLMIIAHGGDEQRRLATLRQTIRECGVDAAVTMHGFQPYQQYLEALRHYHIFLAPSVHAADGDAEGGAPVTVIEMLASGMPIIGSTHCDIPEVLAQGECGLLVPEGDCGALAEAMARLAAEPASWLGYARAGRAHIEREYNVQRQVVTLERVYDELRGVAA